MTWKFRRFTDGTVHAWSSTSDLTPAMESLYFKIGDEGQAYDHLVWCTKNICTKKSPATLFWGDDTIQREYKSWLVKDTQDTQVNQNTQDTPSASSILDEANKIIYGDREKTYGNPAKNLQLIADLWGNYLSHPITISDVCNLMILLKVARLKNSPDHRDSQVDICGYAALMERSQKYMEEQREQDLIKHRATQPSGIPGIDY